ncbi:protein with putative role during mitosis [Alternaria novae-zelandiae]|uniref:protein with putative role during mitosis n=1 Tax=Alternaria ventricosa TaxID=1187951 RepID=UPI0020C59983|nr:protein with putative role during mitosis [Alternaria ventricosa]XP_049243358.1 protein with putative role during mitosis [Alternaria hordeiaustralica]XP_049256961.1 protein with putative role during mitosis [Alternaria novae-zelandiae]XP_051288495.1 protein with putative role during mitosis [Alternaria incomplexa]XP_051324791.1 protein with putative role during mitosis [Alternaria conjuncta]XP_051351101.1 protein with putative role during mitosis [Alternaria infectoria]KAI4620135.1 protei
MSAILTDRQAEELHKAIIAYLGVINAPKTAEAFREEANIAESFDDATRKKYEGLLEKKWTSVVRLQKKVLELEQRNQSLQSELDSTTPTSLIRRNQDPTAWLPRAPARHTLQSHRSPITCVAFHPVFSSLASGSEDTTIKIWDWELGELERTVKGHTKGVLDVDFGGPRGGTLLASCSSDLTIKLWDPSDEYKNIRTLPGHDHSVSAIRFVPSGAAGSPSSGNLLVSASRDKTLRIWDVTTGYCVKTIRGHADWVRDVAPSFDGRWLLSAGNDQTARLWDASSGEPKCTFLGHEHVIECVTIAPPVSYANLAALAGLKKPPPLSSSAEYVATGSRDKTIKIWDGRGTLIKTLTGHDNWIRSLVFHPGGKYLLSASDDKTIRCWDLTQEGRCVKTVTDAHGHFVSCMRWAPNVIKDVPVNGDATNGATNGASKKKEEEAAKAGIRCVIATGCVDLNVRIFAS